MSKNLKVASAKIYDKRTICEVHRELYDIVEEHFSASEQFNDIVNRLEEAYLMAKKMNAKLRQYKFDYDDEWWEQVSEEIRQEKLSHRSQRNEGETK